jgi:hypothetical protein
MLRTAKVLALARKNIWYPGQPGCPVRDPAMRDQQWLPIVGQLGWPVIMRDKRIRRRIREKAALVDAGVQGFVLTGSGQSTTWDQVLLLARNWETIERAVRETVGPCLFALTSGGLRRIEL